jgi:hypothetical protein
MITRCQVRVVQEGLSWDESVTLYHHSDGYPTYMLPLIARAYDMSGRDWHSGRAGKAASVLCAADPGVFEPEAGHELHCDIEYYYTLYTVNKAQGNVNECPEWEVQVFDCGTGFWDAPPTTDNLRAISARMPLSEAVEKAKAIEQNECIPSD